MFHKVTRENTTVIFRAIRGLYDENSAVGAARSFVFTPQNVKVRGGDTFRQGRSHGLVKISMSTVDGRAAGGPNSTVSKSPESHHTLVYGPPGTFRAKKKIT